MWGISLLVVWIHSVYGDCNGEYTPLTVSDGRVHTLTSPGYPDGYVSNISCSWKVMRGGSNVIRIRTVELDTENSDACIEFMDIIPLTPDSPRVSLGRWCQLSYANTVEVFADVIIRFHDTGSSHKFRLDVEAIASNDVCDEGRLITLNASANPMYLFKPVYSMTNTGMSSMQCVWKLVPAAPGDVVLLEAIDFEMNEFVSCSTSRVTIETESHTYKYCERERSRFLVTGRSMKLSMWIADLDFSTVLLKYYSVPHGMMVAPQKLPGKINVTPVSTHAQILTMQGTDFSVATFHWLLKAEENSVVVLEVLDWRFSKCNPRLTVYDGNTTSSRQMFQFCSTDEDSKPPQIFRSSGHVITITLQVTSGVSNGKLTMKYYAKHKYDLQMEGVKAVASPCFININLQNTEMFGDGGFKVQGQPAQCVRIEITDASMQPVSHHFSELIRVFDGHDDTADELGTCGVQRHADVSSTLDVVYVKARQSNQVLMNEVWLKVSSTGDCHSRDLQLPDPRNDFQEISENNVPKSNLMPVTCRWFVNTHDDLRIELKPLQLDLRCHGNTQFCQDGYVKVYSNKHREKKELTTWCCTSSKSVVSDSEGITIVYKTSQPTEDIFKLQYRTTNTGRCPGVFSMEQATTTVNYLRSPNYPGMYPLGYLYCVWFVTAGRDHQKVEFIIKEFETDGSPGNCDKFDFLQLYDGNDCITSPKITEALCGSQLAGRTIRSPGRKVCIQFSSSSAFVGPGFVIAYVAYKEPAIVVCGVELIVDEMLATTEITFQHHSRNKPCSFTLRAAPPVSVVVLQLEFKTEANVSNCSSEWIRIYDGKDSSFALLGERCLSGIIQAESTGPEMYVELATHAQSDLPLRYYSLQEHHNCLPGWSTEKVAVNETQILVFSPRVSLQYIHTPRCNWRLRSNSPLHVVSVTIQGQLQQNQGTEINLYDGYDEESGLLSWSGNITEGVTSTGQYLFIVATGQSLDSPFTIEYASVSAPTTTTTSSPTSSIGFTTEASTTSVQETTSTEMTTTPTSTMTSSQLTSSARRPVTHVPVVPSPLACSCPVVCPTVHCADAAGGLLHGQTALIIGGSLTAFSLLALLILSSLLMARYSRVKHSFRLSHMRRRTSDGVNKITVAEHAHDLDLQKPMSAGTREREVTPQHKAHCHYDEPFEVFDPNDPRLEADLGEAAFGDNLSVRYVGTKVKSSLKYEKDDPKDWLHNTAL